MNIEYVKKIANKVKEHVTGTKLDFPGFIVLMTYWTSLVIYTGRLSVFCVHKKGDPRDVYHFCFTNEECVKVYYDSDFNPAPSDAVYCLGYGHRAYELMNMKKFRSSEKHHTSMAIEIADKFIGDILKSPTKIELAKSIYEYARSWYPEHNRVVYSVYKVLKVLCVNSKLLVNPNEKSILILQIGNDDYLTKDGKIDFLPDNIDLLIPTTEQIHELVLPNMDKKCIVMVDQCIGLMAEYLYDIHNKNKGQYYWDN